MNRLSVWGKGEKIPRRGKGKGVFSPLLVIFSPFPQTDSLFLFPLLEMFSPFPQTESLFTGYHFLNKTIDMCLREIIFTLKLIVCPELLFADQAPAVQKVNNTIYHLNNHGLVYITTCSDRLSTPYSEEQKRRSARLPSVLPDIIFLLYLWDKHCPLELW